VVGVVTSNRPDDAVEVAVPEHCPSCGAPVERVAEQVALRCPNPECPAAAAARLRHFCSRGAMEIEGLGERTLDQLAARGLVTDEASLWDLDPKTLAELPGWGERSAAKLMAELEQAKARPFHRLLFALGIPGVGEGVARRLARRFPSFDRLTAATRDEIEEIDGIGPSLSGSLTAWLSDDRNQRLMERLQRRGIDPVEPEADASTGGAEVLADTVFVVTGTLSRSRRVVKDRLEALGARVVGSVSGATTHLLAGENAGSKLDRARAHGVEILDEDTLDALIGANGGTGLWPT
jgi:DNA ligase (NAD+)